MNKHGLIFGLVFAVLASGVNVSTTYAKNAQETLSEEANTAIVAAEQEVEKAKAAILAGQELITQIPEDSPLMPDVAQVVQSAADNWKVAMDALNGAKESYSRIEAASSEEIASHYALLAKVHSDVASSGAGVVQIAISYIDAVASNKAEALDIINTAMQDALALSAEVQFNCERVKTLIAKTYSK